MNNNPSLLRWIQADMDMDAGLDVDIGTPGTHQIKSDMYILLLDPSVNCRELVTEVRISMSGHPSAQMVQPLPLINGILCPLHSPPQLHIPLGLAGWELNRPAAAIHSFTARLPGGTSPKGMPFTRSSPFTPWGIRRIGTPLAWKRSKGEGIRIGVIDTGVDYAHPDLQDRIGGGINLIQPHLPPYDDNGHGTHICGTIAASSSHGMKGIASDATLYAIKAFDHNGTSYVADIVQGIEWCVRNRIHIINMSFGMRTRSAALEAAVRTANREGVIIAASSGNEGKKGVVDYPASFDCTIAVGATNRDKKIAEFSNRGPNIDIYAPGDNITSTWLDGKYMELSGTSMATSHVSGVLALLMSLKPQAGFRQLLRYLQKGALPVVSSARRAGFLGEVNANRSVRAALALPKKKAGAGSGTISARKGKSSSKR